MNHPTNVLPKDKFTSPVSSNSPQYEHVKAHSQDAKTISISNTWKASFHVPVLLFICGYGLT